MKYKYVFPKYSMLVFVLAAFYACNNIPEAIMLANTKKVDTLDFNDYKYVVDDKNRRGYVTIENEIMEGQYVIKRNGIMVEEFTIQGGFLNGPRILYFENGLPESIETYKTSIQNGPVTSFYESGAIRSETSYTNNIANVEETHYDESGAIILKKVEKDGVVYEHNYRDGNRMVSMFQKTIDEQTYDLIIKYDSFGTVQLVMGKLVDNDSPILYIFDAEFKQIDSFNGQEEPLKAQQYLAVFQSW